MFPFTEVGHRSCLDRKDKMLILFRLCVVVVFVAALVAGVPSSPTIAADWDWLEEQGKKLFDDVYEGTKDAVTGESAQPPEEDDPAPEVQVQDTPAATSDPPKIEQPTPPIEAADTPRADKPWVTEIQTHLMTLGFSPGVIDGAFGNKSQAAITAFQQHRGDRLAGLPTLSVMAALRRDTEATSAVPAPVTTRSPDQATPQVAAAEPVYVAEDLKGLAATAGKYAAWADLCDDPAGADVKSDFLARVELLAPDEQAGIIKKFERRYTRKTKNAEPLLEKCILEGKTTCCTVGPSGQFLGAKERYESEVVKLDGPTAPAESAGSATQSVAAAPELSKEPSSVAASPPERAQPASESPAAALTVSEQASSVATAPAESSGSSGENPVAASASPTPEPAAISSTDQRIGFPGPIGEYVDKLHEYCIQINRFNDPEPINLAYPVITHTHYM